MGPLLLFITTFIWGTAFLAQKVGGEVFGPFAVTCFRSILGGLFLLAVVAIRHSAGMQMLFSARKSLLAGFWCGIPLFAAIVAQQIGIAYTTPGVSAFLTTNYIFFVPLFLAIVTLTLPRRSIVIGASVALAGTYLICLPGEGVRVGRGELWTIFCAVLFAVQMLLVDRFARRSDPLVMSIGQLFTCALIAAPFLFLPDESARLSAFTPYPFASNVFPLIYLGVFSSGIAYTLQNYGQSRTPAALAAIICSMESVFGALAGYFVRGDTLTVAQFVGCSLVFLAAVGTELLPRMFGKSH